MSRFYEVWIASPQYRQRAGLTYAAERQLPPGSIVQVPLQRSQAAGVIIKQTPRPAFASKPISKVYDLPPLPTQLLDLAGWIAEYYPAPGGMITQLLLPGRLSDKRVAAASQLPSGTPALPATATLPPLTAEQQQALDAMDHPDTYLLHGDTGSGKTRVYIEQTLRTLKRGQSAIVMTPEIGLTSQLADSFRAVFGGQVAVLHSQLSLKDRQTVWLDILGAASPMVVVGPRSTLFAPLKNVGLIVADEAHETAYKQEQAPRYHAIRVASTLAGLHGATLILGSATPAVTDYYLARRKRKPVLRLHERARPAGHRRTAIDVVDIRDHAQFSRSRYLSDKLLASIADSLRRGEQSLLYLNRRGTARVVLCAACGWQAQCPHCDLPLTYHHDSFRLRCHTCGFSDNVPMACPQCAHTEIMFKTAGTKAISTEIARLFPDARVMRFDTDNKKSERFEQHFQAVRDGQVDILIGTQLLAKGLDLPRLSTLGVVTADTSLSFPDYTAQERTYQLLTQVIGRVGRGHTSSERVVVQTYVPDAPVIRAALRHDYDTFYTTELAERQRYRFPPFCFLLKLVCRRSTSVNAQKASEQFLCSIQALKLPITVEGPAPAFRPKAEGKYEWQLVVKAARRNDLLRVVAALPASGWTYDIDPQNLL